eukprot:s737_g41.t1
MPFRLQLKFWTDSWVGLTVGGLLVGCFFSWRLGCGEASTEEMTARGFALKNAEKSSPLSTDELHLKIVGGDHLDNEERVRESLKAGDECYLLGKDSEGPKPKPEQAEGYKATPPVCTPVEKKVAKTADGKLRCKNFGCQKLFDPDGPPQECQHHKAAPIFHETAKWWSCCPDSKAYDFDEFMKIPGCTQGFCTNESQAKKVAQPPTRKQSVALPQIPWRPAVQPMVAATHARRAARRQAAKRRRARQCWGLGLAGPAGPNARGPRPETPCVDCGETANCACGFRAMDPFHPVSAVLAVTPLAPMWQPLAGKGAAFAELQILSPCSEGEVIELRMTTKDQLAVPQHRWPYEMKILLDGKEVLHLDPPETKRREAPLQLEQMEAGIVRQLQLFAWDAPMGVTPGLKQHRDWCAARDMILCVVLVRPRSVAELLAECRQRPDVSRESSLQLQKQAASQETEVTCETPWVLPLRCPLTMDRLREPARGIHCKHLQCVELEAFLITASLTQFQRRWRCPICSAYLPPKQLARCELTRTLGHWDPLGTLFICLFCDVLNLLHHLAPKMQAPLDAVLGAAGRLRADDVRGPSGTCPARGQGSWGQRLRCEVQHGGELD